jgi:hypothetical protein
MVKERDPPPFLSGVDGAHHSRSTGANDDDIEVFHAGDGNRFVKK